MRIIHLIHRYPPALGGSESWCREVAREQVRRGHQVRVLTLDIIKEAEFWSAPGKESRLYRLGRLDLDQGVEIRRFRRSLPGRVLKTLVFELLLDRLLGFFLLGPHSLEMLACVRCEIAWADLVHLHALPYPHVGLGLHAARQEGRPVVLTPHFHAGHPAYERRHQLRRIRRAACVAVISSHEKEILRQRGVSPSRISVLGCGQPGPSSTGPPARAVARQALRARLGVAPGTGLVICLAQKTAYKGLKSLVEAVWNLVQEGRDVALILAGPTTAWFEDFYRRLAAPTAAHVFDLGEVDETTKVQILAGADVFAMPSRYEAFGMVFLEAWAAGLPVVGGRDGAQPEVIGEGGATVPFEDPPALASALAHYLDDPEAAAQAVAWGRTALEERYRWDHVVTGLLKIYRRLLTRSPGSSRLVRTG